MRALIALLALAAGPATNPVQSLAGRYYRQFPDATIDGSKYTGQDIVEIVPVTPRAAYVRLSLDFFNGHVCGIYGVATVDGDALVYRDPRDPDDGGQPCTLTLRQQGGKLRWDDTKGSCQSYCGARGSLNGDLPFASKRPIRYLPRLKASRQYQEAIEEWRTGKPVNP